MGADVFIGVSAPGMVTSEMVQTMAKDAILFPMRQSYAGDHARRWPRKLAPLWWRTGRSDFPNQINNVLAFPGIFRGTLRCACVSTSTMP